MFYLQVLYWPSERFVFQANGKFLQVGVGLRTIERDVVDKLWLRWFEAGFAVQVRKSSADMSPSAINALAAVA